MKPGVYTYYGSVFFAPNGGYAGVCDCMGTIKFKAGAGKITNLGDFLGLHWATSDELKQSSYPASSGEIPWDPVPVDYALPDSLSSWPSVKPEFRAAGKMDNFYGIRIGRFPPLPSVLAYDRDKVIDLKAKAEPESSAKAPAMEAEQGSTEAATAAQEATAANTGPSQAAEKTEDVPGDSPDKPVGD